MRFLIVFILLAAIALPGVPSGKARDARVTSTTFTVDTLSEGWDANPGDGVCATSGGKCTLRAAILETNALSGADTIILPAGNYEMTIHGTLEDDSVTGDLDD